MTAGPWPFDGRQFEPPLDCPQPGCGQKIAATDAGALGRCAACGGLYEIERLTRAAGDRPLEWPRRAEARFCTLTGRPQWRRSALDWCEHGGGPGRASAVADLHGALFGAPLRTGTFQLELAPGWRTDDRLGERRAGTDLVSSVSVLRGRVVVVSRCGQVVVLDPVRGEPLQTLEWPDASTVHDLPDRAVEFAPAGRGATLLVAAPHMAVFFDLSGALYGNPRPAVPRVVRPASATGSFCAPPLAIGDDDPLFCLAEWNDGAASLRFFTREGEEHWRYEPPAPPARAPIYDERSRELVWVDENRWVYLLGLDAIRGRAAADTRWSDPSEQRVRRLDVRFTSTFLAAEDHRGDVELWLAGLEANGDTTLYRASLDAVRRRQAGWHWAERTLGALGAVHALAAGRGSTDVRNAGRDLLAVASDRAVYVFDKQGTREGATDVIRGGDGVGGGSYDLPVICSAGVLVRTHEVLSLSGAGTAWGHAGINPWARVESTYRHPQGMAVHGCRIYLGAGRSVLAFDLVRRNTSVGS